MGKTDIAWTDETWNPIRGCTRISLGCKNCYAERHTMRRLESFIDAIVGKRLTYARLIAPEVQA